MGGGKGKSERGGELERRGEVVAQYRRRREDT
jgi:hypothetical protein